MGKVKGGRERRQSKVRRRSWWGGTTIQMNYSCNAPHTQARWSLLTHGVARVATNHKRPALAVLTRTCSCDFCRAVTIRASKSLPDNSLVLNDIAHTTRFLVSW